MSWWVPSILTFLACLVGALAALQLVRLKPAAKRNHARVWFVPLGRLQLAVADARCRLLRRPLHIDRQEFLEECSNQNGAGFLLLASGLAGSGVRLDDVTVLIPRGPAPEGNASEPAVYCRDTARLSTVAIHLRQILDTPPDQDFLPAGRRLHWLRRDDDGVAFAFGLDLVDDALPEVHGRAVAKAYASEGSLREQRLKDAETIRVAKSKGFNTFDIFVSHAGTEKLDVVALLKEHIPRHYNMFADAWDLHTGDRSEEKMISTCGTAKVGVVIISEEFVRRPWPMRELHILVERHGKGEVGLVPVLWMDDFDNFDAVVASYEQCRDCRCLWYEDLKYLTTICMKERRRLTPERALPVVVKEAVSDAVRLLKRVSPSAPVGLPPVGIDDQVACLVELMKHPSGKAVWLHGPGGAGKSCMAEHLQRALEEQGLVKHVAKLTLEFTADEGPTLSEEQAFALHKDAVSALSGRDCSSTTPDEVRRRFAEDAIQPATLLLVDNVHSKAQIGLLLGHLCLDKVPFLIFTSRLATPSGGGTVHANVWARVLQRGLYKHEVEPLPEATALSLFRTLCYRPQCVPDAVEQRVVAVCGGLPLALVVLAGVLTDQADAGVWTDMEDRMLKGGKAYQGSVKASEVGLQEVVGYSLLRLDEGAVGMFLDCACVLVGRAQRDAVAVWRAWHGRDRADEWLRELTDRHLVSVDKDENLQVHDVLRWFARRVVRGETGEHLLPHRGSRLWVHDGRVEPKDVAEAAGIVTAQLDHGWRDWRAPPASSLGMEQMDTARILLAGRQSVNIPCTGSLHWLEVAGEGWSEKLGSAIRHNGQLCVLHAWNVLDLIALPPELGQLSALQTLDLGWCRGLTSLPEAVGQLSSLKVLNLGSCSGLTSLPEEVGHLSALQTLYLGQCKGLTSLPQGVAQLSALKTLDLEWCSRLTSLPEGVGQLSALLTLNLQQCTRLTSLPEGLGQLCALQTLNLASCNGRKRLPEGLGQLSVLKTLILTDCNGLTSLPKRLGQLSALQTLELEFCRGLTSLPEGLGQLSALLTLNLGACIGLTLLPEEFGQLSALQTLNLRGCKGLTSLPEGLGQLSALQTLNLAMCFGLTSLPEGLGQLSTLQTLDLTECRRLTSLPENGGQLSALQTLKLGWCSELTSLPEWVGQLSALQELNLYTCSRLTSLPESVAQLSALHTLTCACKGLTSLPWLGQLSVLVKLNLTLCSGLTSLPDWVGQLSALQTLDLSGCTGLTSLPAGLWKLNALRTLNLGCCTGLTSLPEGVGQLSALQALDLSFCSWLTSLPGEVGQLSALQTLNLRMCRELTSLPEWVERLSALQTLDLRGCNGLTSWSVVGRLQRKGVHVYQ